jgi:hypothetical protein
MNDSPYKLAEETERIIQIKLAEMGFSITDFSEHIQWELTQKIKVLNYLRTVRTSIELLERELLKVPVQ